MPKFDGYTFIIHSQTIKVLTKDYESGEFTLQVGNYSTKKRLCQNAGTTFFYAQSPDFPKPRLCYYPKFM